MLDEPHGVVQVRRGALQAVRAVLVLDRAGQIHLRGTREIVGRQLHVHCLLILAAPAEAPTAALQEAVPVAHPFLRVVKAGGHRSLLT
jgi:hypothetical protein